MGDGLEVLDLTEDIGELVLQQSRRVGKAWERMRACESVALLAGHRLCMRLTSGHDLYDLISTDGLERKECPESFVQRGVALDVEETVGELLKLFGRYLNGHVMLRRVMLDETCRDIKTNSRSFSDGFDSL